MAHALAWRASRWLLVLALLLAQLAVGAAAGAEAEMAAEAAGEEALAPAIPLAGMQALPPGRGAPPADALEGPALDLPDLDVAVEPPCGAQAADLPAEDLVKPPTSICPDDVAAGLLGPPDVPAEHVAPEPGPAPAPSAGGAAVESAEAADGVGPSTELGQETEVPLDPRPDPGLPLAEPRGAPAVPLQPAEEAPRPVALRLLAMAAAAAVSVPLALLAKLLLGLLRARKARSSHRPAVLAAIEEDPGIHKAALARRLGVGPGTVSHHVHALVRQGRVLAVRTAGHTCLFPAGAMEARLVAIRLVARAPAASLILRRLAAGPSSLQALAREVGLALSTVHYHLGRLQASGAIASTRLGGRRMAALTGDGLRCVPRPPGAPPA